MAQFKMEFSDDIMKDFKKIYESTTEIFGAMTTAGAEAAASEIRSNLPPALRDSEIVKCIKVTRVYRTPSDDGINTKVGFYGYFKNKKGRVVPAPLIANVFEYGRSNAPFPKQPFLRKAFNKSKIEKAMLEAQKKASGGLLDE